MQRLKNRSAGLVDTLYTVHAGHCADIGEDGLELAAIGDFQAGVDARIRTVRAAFQAVNVGARAADYGGNLSQKAGAIAGADHELHLEGGGSCPTPLDGDAAFRLIQEILDIRTRASMNRDATPARDVTDDVVAGNRIAALRAIHEKIVIALHDQRGFAKAEHALYGFDECGLCVFRRRLSGLRGIAENAREHLARGIFPKSYRGIEILTLREAGIGGDPQQLLLWNFLKAAAEVARFLFQQALPHLHGFFALLQIDPMTDLAARVRGLGEAEPITAGGVTFLCEDFHDIAADNLVP